MLKHLVRWKRAKKYRRVKTMGARASAAKVERKRERERERERAQAGNGERRIDTSRRWVRS